jgi:hypothetical protein
LHHRPVWGNHGKQEPFSQVNRGPKNEVAPENWTGC